MNPLYVSQQIRSATTDMYIAAKFETKLPEMFVLGDEQSYGSYINRRLKNDQTYRVFVRAYFDKTVSQDLITYWKMIPELNVRFIVLFHFINVHTTLYMYCITV